MRTPLRIVLALAAAGAVMLGVVAPTTSAQASTVGGIEAGSVQVVDSVQVRMPHAARVRADDATVTGQPWSAPAFPVSCTVQDSFVTCTPTDASQVRETTCFLRVRYAGRPATVCTSFEGHHDALEASGGKETVVQFGCSFGDVVCATFENLGRGAAILATSLMYGVLDVTRFDVGGALWNAATQQWSFWAWTTLIILFIAMVWAVTAAVISGERDQLVGAILRTFIAIPAVPATLWLTGQLTEIIDGLTKDLITGGTGTSTLFEGLLGAMWSGGQAGYVFGFLIYGLVFIGMLLLLFVFLFRNLALAALIMVGPIAWMIFPTRSVGPQWVIRYASAVIVLLLTGPLTMAFFSLVIHGLATVHTIWDPNAWPYVIGLVLIAFAPFAVFGMFTFVGATAVDAIGSRMGSHAASAGGRTARTAVAIPSRIASHAARTPTVKTTSLSTARASAARPAGAAPSSRPARTNGRTAPARAMNRTVATASAPTASSSTSSSAPARVSAPSNTRPPSGPKPQGGAS